MIYFYNTFHNGDVHYSRSFVRDIIKKLPNNDYCYLHNNNPKILKDIQNLKYDKAFFSFDNWNLISAYPISYYEQIIFKTDDIYINTWVGQQDWITKNGLNRNRDNHYCSLYSLYELYEDIFHTLNISIEKIDYYLPEIDFNFIEKNNIDDFISNSNSDLKIMINNNFPLTVRIDLDINSVVSKLSEKYSNVLFFLTMKTNIDRKNVVYTPDIIKLDCDMNENSYLSTKCDIIVGRPSGSYCFTMIKDNFIKNKQFITISDNIYDNFYFESDAILTLLTNHTSDGLIDVLEQKIKKLL
jgi:hypothetical protein